MVELDGRVKVQSAGDVARAREVLVGDELIIVMGSASDGGFQRCDSLLTAKLLEASQAVSTDHRAIFSASQRWVARFNESAEGGVAAWLSVFCLRDDVVRFSWLGGDECLLVAQNHVLRTRGHRLVAPGVFFGPLVRGLGGTYQADDVPSDMCFPLGDRWRSIVLLSNEVATRLSDKDVVEMVVKREECANELLDMAQSRGAGSGLVVELRPKAGEAGRWGYA